MPTRSRRQSSLAFPTTSLKTLSSTISISDRKSTRLNSSHSQISYAVFFLIKKLDSFTPLSAIRFQTAFHDRGFDSRLRYVLTPRRSVHPTTYLSSPSQRTCLLLLY